MIIGIGIDIVNIKRFEKVVKNNPEILKRIFTENELNLFENYKNKYLHLAGRFSLKESIIKAGQNYLNIKSFKDIEILKDENGKPIVAKPKGKIFISISHDENYVVSFAVIED